MQLLTSMCFPLSFPFVSFFSFLSFFLYLYEEVTSIYLECKVYLTTLFLANFFLFYFHFVIFVTASSPGR
jgi:hypothetical protein